MSFQQGLPDIKEQLERESRVRVFNRRDSFQEWYQASKQSKKTSRKQCKRSVVQDERFSREAERLQKNLIC